MGRLFTTLMSAGLAACLIGPPYVGEIRGVLVPMLVAAWVVSWISVRAGALVVCWMMPIVGLIAVATRIPPGYGGDPPPPRAECFGLVSIFLFGGALLIALLGRRPVGPELPIARISPTRRPKPGLPRPDSGN